MRAADYFTLGLAGIKAHKKRAAMVVVVSGVLFGIAAAGVLLLHGSKDAVLATMLAPTEGRILVMSSIDEEYFEEEYRVAEEVAKMKEKITTYGGKVILAKIIREANESFYALESDIFARSVRGTEKTQVLIPAGTTVRERYEVVGLLPNGIFAENLSFRNAGQLGNPLDMIFGRIKTGTSESFIVSDEAGGEDTEKIGLVFAEFPDLKAAEEYYHDAANFCDEYQRVGKSCGRDYHYFVRSAISEPVLADEKFQEITPAIVALAMVLTVVATIVMFGTYIRLIGKDEKIIALYRAMGATTSQIRLIYLVYFMALSLMTTVLALGIGILTATIISLINQETLSQVFTLGFGIEIDRVWLVGWSDLLFVMIGASLLPAVLVSGMQKIKSTQKLA